MKKLTFVILLLAIVSNSFAKQGIHKKGAAGKKINCVEIYHTACFGRCPQYKLEVNKNGMATYTGMRFTPDSGKYTKKIGIKKAQEIISAFTTARVDTCQDRYESRIQDAPGVVLTIKYNKGEKSIYNANYGPAMLHELWTSMDNILEQKVIDNELQPLDKSWHKKGSTHK